MARKIEELLIEINGDNKDILKALKESERGIDGLGKKSGGLFKGIAKGAAVGAAAIAGIGAAAVGLGVKIASETELAKVAFTTLLGSAENAQKMIEDLRDFAAKTPFEFAGVRDAAQKFLAMGFAAEDVIPILTSVGDAVAAMGGGAEEIGGVTRALTQIQAKGKVAAEEMLQLAERGIPAWEFLAAKLGTDIPTAMEEVTKGAVQSATFIEAFMEGTANRFGGAMEAQSQTLSGLFSTLKDTIMVELGAASESLLEPLKDAIPLLSQALGGIISTALPPLAAAIGSLLPVVTALLPSLGAIAGVVGKVLGALAPILVKLAEALLPVIEALIPVVDALLPVLLPLLETLVVLVEALAPLIEIVALALAFLLVPLAAAIKKNQEFIQKGIKPLGKALQWLADVVGVGTKFMLDNWDGFKRGLTVIWDAIVGLFKDRWETVKGILSKGGEFFKGVWDGLKTGLQAALDYVIDRVNAAIKLMNKLPGVSIPLIGEVAETVQGPDVAASTGASSGSSGGGSSRSSRSSVSRAASTVGTAVKVAVRSTVAAAKKVGSAVASAAKKAWGSIKKRFSFDDPQNDAMAFRWGNDFGNFWMGGLNKAMQGMQRNGLSSLGPAAAGISGGRGGVSLQTGDFIIHLPPGEGNEAGVRRGVLSGLSAWERRVGAQEV